MPSETPDPSPLARRRKPAQGQVENYRPRPKRSEFDEFPSEDDIERFGGVTIPCPRCGAELYDDVALCWNCGHAVGARLHAGEGIPRWVLVVAGLVAVCLALLAIL
jgi:uncharacterized protein (DUF983 family)